MNEVPAIIEATFNRLEPMASGLGPHDLIH
jgi:hypothetical protein